MKHGSEVEKLTQAYLDGSLDGAAAARLNAILLDDELARQAFVESLNLDSALAAAAEGWEFELQAETALPVTAAAPAWKPWAALAACAAVMLVTVFVWHSAQPPIATVEKSVGVGAGALTAGTRIGKQRHHLKEGTIELLTNRGALVIIEAPAEFQFETAQHLHMLRGRLSAEVPDGAKGFTVTTPFGKAIDLGTRFGVDVPATGAAEIHVFEGEVVARANGTSLEQNLLAGDALALHPGSSVSLELRSSAFIQSDEMRDLSIHPSALGRARSQAVLENLRADPSAVLILDFESQSETYPGVYRMVQGRWPGTRAPEFIHRGDHLKLEIGEGDAWPRLTLAAWVRLDQLGAPYQSLLHADGWDNGNFGLIHWMVNEATTMRFATFGNQLIPTAIGSDVYPDSRTPVLAKQGRWIHLAVVYDSDLAAVKFYHNGRFDNEAPYSEAHPAKLGPSQIGNWNEAERKLSGRVDELIILRRAMEAAEIRELFDAGNPY